jgi:catechol 2,3-dioxygenase-like lactoylglutathione lyase family enzyme
MVMRVAIPVLPCRDVEAARSYFTDVLGFDTIFTWETPPTYAAVIRDTAEFHLYAEPSFGPARAAVIVDDVDSCHDELHARGADIVEPLADRPYGMRDFNVRTPDGHVLIFSQPLSGPPVTASRPDHEVGTDDS